MINNICRYIQDFLGLKNSSSKLLVIILVIAAVARIWHISSLHPLPLFDELTIDSKIYDEWARYIAKGNWLGGNNAFYMDPLYPYLLAVQYKIFGHNLLVVRLVQATFGVAVCFLVAVIGRRVGGGSVGLISALLAALYQPLIFEGGEVEKTAIGVLLITASLTCATGKSATSKFSAGILLALASLCRANLLLMGPLGAIFFLLGSDNGLSSNGKGIKTWLRAKVLGKPARDATVFMLGFILMLSPVLLRNHYVSGEWVVTTSQSGTNFYTGNNPSNSIGIFTAVPFVRPLPEFEERDFHTKAEELSGKKLTAKEVSSFWFHAALEHMANDPLFASKVILRKFILFWGDLESADGWSFYFLKKFSPVLGLPLFTFGWIFPFAVIGAAISFRHGREARLLTGFVLVYSCTVIMFFIFSRYRIYVVPPLFIFAAVGMKWLWGSLLERNWRKFASGIAVVTAASIFSFCGSSSFVNKSDMFVYDYVELAELYSKRNDFEAAEALLHEALHIQPGSAEVLYAMGSLYLSGGDLDGAIDYLRRSLTVSPENNAAWSQLGLAYEKLGNHGEAKRCYEKRL